MPKNGDAYPHRAHIQSQDKYLAAALDEFKAQILTVAKQTGANPNGTQTAPPSPAQLLVSVTAGNFSATIVPRGANVNTRYLLQHAETANFQDAVTVDLGISINWKQNLAGLTLYFRCAARFPTSENSGWVYYGSPASPIAVTG